MMSLHDAATLSGAPTSNEIALRKYCLDKAAALNPKDAGDLIKKAAGIYSWVIATSVEKVSGE